MLRDVEMMESEMAEMVSRVGILQERVTSANQEKEMLATSLKELKHLIDKEALKVGLKSGEVLVELAQHKEMLKGQEDALSSERMDKAILIEFVKELRKAAKQGDTDLLLAKLFDPGSNNTIAASVEREDVLHQKLEALQKENKLLSEKLKAREQSEKAALKSKKEMKSELNQALKRLDETIDKRDTLHLGNRSLHKKYNHLKSVQKKLDAFCRDASSMKHFNDLSEVQSIDALDDMERQLINLSSGALGTENRSFIKLFMSLVCEVLEHRRCSIRLEEELEVTKATLRQNIHEATLEKGKPHSGTYRAGLSSSRRRTPERNEDLRSQADLQHFAFTTKSYADSMHDTRSLNTVESEQTSKLENPEREFHLRSAAKQRQSEADKSRPQRQESFWQYAASVNRPGPSHRDVMDSVAYLSRSRPSESQTPIGQMEESEGENSDTAEQHVISPGSVRRSYPTPHNKSTREKTKHTVRERIQLLQERFQLIGQS